MGTRYNERGLQWVMGGLIGLAALALGGLMFLWLSPQSTPQAPASPSSFSRSSEELALSGSLSQEPSDAGSSENPPSTPWSESLGSDAEAQALQASVAADFESTVVRPGETQALYFHELSQPESQALIRHPQPLRSASIIKLFVMQVYLDALKDGRLDGQSVYSLTAEDQVGGTGNLQVAPVGSEWTLDELAQLMITESDNTATNILIAQLGGVMAVNQRIQYLGYHATQLNRLMMDQAAIEAGQDNYTSVAEVGQLLTRLYHHQLVDVTHDQAFLDILAQQTDQRGLVQSLPRADDAVTIYSKSGQNPTQGLQHDASLVVWNAGKSGYVCVVFLEGGEQATQLAALQTFGRQVYERVHAQTSQ